MSTLNDLNDLGPNASPRGWRNSRYYPANYQRGQLRLNIAELRRNPRLEWEGKDLAGRDQQNDPWRQLVGVLEHAENIHRFSDRRQIPFEGKPLPDGSNIEANGSQTLNRTWYLYRSWLEFLYTNTLSEVGSAVWSNYKMMFDLTVVNEEFMAVLVHHILPEIKRVAEEEEEQVPVLKNNLWQYDSVDELGWIPSWRLKMANVAQDMVAAGKWAVHTRITPELDAMGDVYKSLEPFERVLVSILYKEELFEKRLCACHVEDEHYIKRMRIIATDVAGQYGFRSTQNLSRQHFGKVLTLTQHFQKRLRDLFTYRQVRDWGYGRPWFKMHLCYQIEGAPLLKEAVGRVHRLLSCHPRAKDLFGVLPKDLSTIAADPCAICFEDWSDQDLAMETHCHHYFHAACLIRYWDEVKIFDFRCPACRTSGGRVRDRVVFKAEREDWAPDAAQQAAHDWIFAEYERGIPPLDEDAPVPPTAVPDEYALVVGRHIEAMRLRDELAEQDNGEGPLPLP